MRSGAEVCKSCRPRQELSNEYLVAKFGFDTAENEPERPRIRIWDIIDIRAASGGMVRHQSRPQVENFADAGRPTIKTIRADQIPPDLVRVFLAVETEIARACGAVERLQKLIQPLDEALVHFGRFLEQVLQVPEGNLLRRLTPGGVHTPYLQTLYGPFSAGWLAGKPDYPPKLKVPEGYEKINDYSNI